MEKFKPIPEAKQKINKLLRVLELKPEKRVNWFIKRKKHLYSTKCVNKKGQLVFIKVVLDNKERFFASLKREAQIIRYFTKNKSLIKKIKIAPYLQGDFKKPVTWFTHCFVPGKKLGEFYDLFGTSTKYLKPLIANLVGLHKISSSHLRKIKRQIKELNTVEAKDYKKIIQDHQRNSPKLRRLVDFESINCLLKKQFGYLKKAPIVLTHGDFTFSNQIVSQGQIYLNDWEWVRFDNFCVDLAHLWVQSWRYPIWQRQLLKIYQQQLDKKLNKIFEECFKIIVIVQALNELRWNVEICPEKYKKGASRFCLATIKKVLQKQSLIGDGSVKA